MDVYATYLEWLLEHSEPLRDELARLRAADSRDRSATPRFSEYATIADMKRAVDAATRGPPADRPYRWKDDRSNYWTTVGALPEHPLGQLRAACPALADQSEPVAGGELCGRPLARVREGFAAVPSRGDCLGRVAVVRPCRVVGRRRRPRRRRPWALEQ